MGNSLRSKLWLLTLLLALPAFCLSAQEAGKVYQIVNDQYGVAMTINGPNGIISCSAPDATNYDQLWEAEAVGRHAFAFKNISTGRYLKSSRARSSAWSLEDAITDASTFTISKVGSTSSNTIRAKADTWDMLFAHCDGSKNVVCWDASAPTSQWIFTEAEITEADRNQAAGRLDAMNTILAGADAYADALKEIFTDGACTTLAAKYAGMSASQLAADATVASLPQALRDMVVKVANGKWDESYSNGITWSGNYARKFRVQNYEVFSRGNETAPLTGIQAYTNMNNPTGIIADAYDVLYVMVDAAPKDGATLYYGHAPGMGMYNDWQTDYELHEGLNVIPVWTNNSIGYIYYTADTYSNDQRTHKLAEFPDIKIHIEGGQVNSFFNSIGDALYTPDTREDFNYYRDRARHPMYDIVGKYTILHFFFDRTETDVNNGNYCDGVKQLLGPDSKLDIATVIHQWDELGLTERLIMGLESDEEILRANTDAENGRGDWYIPLADDDIAPNDFSEYFNQRHMGITMQGGLYMNATWWRTAYNGSTMPSILDLFNGGNIWGPAHEYGHMNQGPMKIAGTTEISNNHFSNVAVYTHTNRTIRANMISDQVNTFNKGLTFLENGIWGTTRMYFQLWLYYHAVGHNKAFYPRLYELLRRNPLQKSYYLNPRYDALHFVKMCCLAAQEDLTDYFDAWGFFVPLKDYHIGDYANYYATLTQEDIDAVKAEIKAYNFPKNRAILFLDERVGSPKESWADYMAKEMGGDLGGIEDFRKGCPVTKPYSFLLNGTTVTMSGGEGGVGFMIYSNDGKLLGFSNSYEFPVSTAAAQALLNGTAHVEAIGTDGTGTSAESTLDQLSPADRAAMLQNMIDNVIPIAEHIDAEGRIVGFYKANYAAKLIELRDEAEALIRNGKSDDYADMYNRLANEYFDFTNNTHTRIEFIPGSIYHLTLRGPKEDFSRPLRGGRNNPTAPANIDLESDYEHWEFIPMDGGKYALRNIHWDKYLAAPVRDQQVKMSDKPEALTVSFRDEYNYVAIYQGESDNAALNYNTGTKVIGWDAGNWNSQWRLTLIEPNREAEAAIDLKEMIETTEELIDKAGTVVDESREMTIDPQLSDERYFTNAKCKSTQYGDQFTSFMVVNDDDSQTFFHSDYSGANSDDGLDHYIGINLGLDDDSVASTVTSFQVGYTTRGSGNEYSVYAPTSVTIEGSADGENWIKIADINSGLPTATNTEYLSDVLESETPVNMVRMVVHTNNQGRAAGGHQYFVVSEFHLFSPFFSATPNGAYPRVTPELLAEVYYALKAAKAVYATSDFASRAGAQEMRDARSELGVARQKLADAMGVVLGIEEVLAPEGVELDGQKGIYDLQGRRLRAITAPGLYIIDGRKTFVGTAR